MVVCSAGRRHRTLFTLVDDVRPSLKRLRFGRAPTDQQLHNTPPFTRPPIPQLAHSPIRWTEETIAAVFDAYDDPYTSDTNRTTPSGLRRRSKNQGPTLTRRPRSASSDDPRPLASLPRRHRLSDSTTHPFFASILSRMPVHNVRWGVVGLGGIAKRFLDVRFACPQQMG